jgi:hypothetical protein
MSRGQIIISTNLKAHHRNTSSTSQKLLQGRNNLYVTVNMLRCFDGHLITLARLTEGHSKQSLQNVSFYMLIDFFSGTNLLRKIGMWVWVCVTAGRHLPNRKRIRVETRRKWRKKTGTRSGEAIGHRHPVRAPEKNREAREKTNHSTSSGTDPD